MEHPAYHLKWAAWVMMLCFGQLVWGKTIYVDADSGKDANSGLSPACPVQTLHAINAGTFAPGDTVLFKASTAYTGRLVLKSSGAPDRPIVIGMYGQGQRPRINGNGLYDEAVLIYNAEYLELTDLEITNKAPERKARRAGVRVHIHDFGTAHQITLRNLFVHDVYGVNNKKLPDGGFTETTGITCDNSSSHTPSRFDGLLIERCRLLRTDRDGIATRSTHKDRESNWYPNLNVVIRGNTLEDVGGDGIVTRGCDGALIEHNIVCKGNQRCPDYAAGIWPHSCDNTVIQFNEVCFLKGTLDAMAFDSDGNCRNTLIQYNYSHDNEGGFFMICGGKTNIGNVVRYNISQNDEHRLIYITGAVQDTDIYNNVVYLGEDKTAYAVWPGGGKKGYANDIRFANNIFYFQGVGKYNFGEMTGLTIENNVFYGNHEDLPDTLNAIKKNPKFAAPGSGGRGMDTLDGYRLMPGSPCFDAGVIIPNNGGRDFGGDAVPADSKPEIGAFQFGGE